MNSARTAHLRHSNAPKTPGVRQRFATPSSKRTPPAALGSMPRDNQDETRGVGAIRIRSLMRRAEHRREVPVSPELLHALRSLGPRSAAKPLSRTTAHRHVADVMAAAGIQRTARRRRRSGRFPAPAGIDPPRSAFPPTRPKFPLPQPNERRSRKSFFFPGSLHPATFHPRSRGRRPSAVGDQNRPRRARNPDQEVPHHRANRRALRHPHKAAVSRNGLLTSPCFL